MYTYIYFYVCVCEFNSFTCSNLCFLSDEEAIDIQKSDKVVDEHRSEQAVDGKVDVKGQPLKNNR